MSKHLSVPAAAKELEASAFQVRRLVDRHNLVATRVGLYRMVLRSSLPRIKRLLAEKKRLQERSRQL